MPGRADVFGHIARHSNAFESIFNVEITRLLALTGYRRLEAELVSFLRLRR
jgi:hypothetical protein